MEPETVAVGELGEHRAEEDGVAVGDLDPGRLPEQALVTLAELVVRERRAHHEPDGGFVGGEHLGPQPHPVLELLDRERQPGRRTRVHPGRLLRVAHRDGVPPEGRGNVGRPQVACTSG